MPDENTVTPREFELQEKLNQERNSAVHLRIAAVEAQARSDREVQALVNKSLGERIDGVKAAVDHANETQSAGFKEQAKAFNELRIGILVLGIAVCLTLMANLPGLLAVLKGKV